MSSLSKLQSDANGFFQQAVALKDKAISSLAYLDLYIEAATAFRTAATLYRQVADETHQLDGRIQVTIYANYWCYEAAECEAAYFYEKRMIDRALALLDEAIELAGQNIEIFKESWSSLSLEVQEHMDSHRQRYDYLVLNTELKRMAYQARGYVEAKDFVHAFDLYRTVAKKVQGLLALSESDAFDPAFERIDSGNYFGILGNASQALVQILQHHVLSGEDEDQYLTEMLGGLLNAYRFGRKAFAANPQWSQYKAHSDKIYGCVAGILESHPDRWTEWLIQLDEAEDLKRIMKRIDPKKAAKAEEPLLKDHKSVQLWLRGGFFMLLLSFCFGAVYMLAGLPWYKFLGGIFALEALVVVLGAFTLRSIGELSEAGLLNLAGLALRQQALVITDLVKSRSSTQK